jgi:hypothetical protein
MTIATYKKTFVAKNGDVKVYEYQKEAKVYTQKAYQTKKAKHPKVECKVCGRMVYGFYMLKHQQKQTCNPPKKPLVPVEEHIITF